MANAAFITQILGFYYVKLKVKGDICEHVKRLTIKTVCCDIILGHNFLNTIWKPEPPLKCVNVKINMRYPALFSNLTPESKPIAGKSRHYCEEESIVLSNVKKSYRAKQLSLESPGSDHCYRKP